MSKLRFTDGVNVETSGPLRLLQLGDGWYITGKGMLIPCTDYEDAKVLLHRMVHEPEKLERP